AGSTPSGQGRHRLSPLPRQLVGPNPPPPPNPCPLSSSLPQNRTAAGVRVPPPPATPDVGDIGARLAADEAHGRPRSNRGRAVPDLMDPEAVSGSRECSSAKCQLSIGGQAHVTSMLGAHTYRRTMPTVMAGSEPSPLIFFPRP